MPNPLISCLMITRPSAERAFRLRMTLQDFARQTHPNREMIVVIDAASTQAAEPVLREVARAGLGNIRAHVVGQSMPLGALRNLSWSQARGEFVCTWDDDDRHHPTRLEEQLAALLHSGYPVCYLQEFLHYFVQERRIFRVNFRPAPDPVAVNTIMCRRDLALRYPETGPQAQRAEDVALFEAIRHGASFHALPDRPHLFVYVNHGSNTCSNDDHRHLVDQMGATKGLLCRNEQFLRQGLAAFDFGTETLIVTGRNGDAFVLESSQTNSTATVSL